MRKKVLGLPFYRWLLPVFALLLAVMFYTGVPGFSFSGLVCIGISGIFLCYNLISVLKPKYPKTLTWIRRIFTVFLCLGILVVVITGVIIIRATKGNPDQDCTYVVALGCQVRKDGPSLSLQERIQATFDYMQSHPNTIVVLSGGQGPDEPMTEAQCMFDRLCAMGIDPQRLWKEESATSTWENLVFSLDLIEERTGTRPTTIGLISSEYHLYRASLQAKDCGVTAIGIPAKTSWAALRWNNYLREVAGVWHYIILGD